ncbi:MAG: SUMF1/EgtB/PvdO family nonheme iron enzyme [Planctomycetota bacterium]
MPPSQRLLNGVAAARVCLLKPEKKTAYDQWLRQNLQSIGVQADRSDAYSLDPGLAAAIETRRTRPSAITSGGAEIQSQPKPAVFVGVAVLTVVVVGLAALWWAMGGSGTPREGKHAKADLPALAKSSKEVSLKLPVPAGKKTLTTDAAKQKEESKADEPKAVPVSKPPEPKTEEETKTTPIPDKTAKAKLVALSDHPAKKPVPDEEQATAKKFNPPLADDQKRLMNEIDEVYKPGGAKNLVARVALGHKLLEDGRKNETNRAEQFVLLRRAAEIASDAGEADLMLEAVDAMAAVFNIRPFQVKTRLLKRLLGQGSSGGTSQLSTVSASCVKFAEEAAVNGAIDEAFDVLDAAKKWFAEPIMRAQARVQSAQREARAAARRKGGDGARNPSDAAEREKKVAEAEEELDAIKTAQSALSDCDKSLQQARRDRDTIQSAQERLKIDPDDHVACLVVGRWQCFIQGDWDKGLNLLAKSSDDALKSLAAEELASKPSTTKGKITRGDAWWELAEKAADRSKAAMRRRAGHWYQEALPDLAQGLGKSRVEKRLAQAAEEPMPETDGRSPRVRPPLATAPFNEKIAKMHQARWGKYLGVSAVQTNSIGMKLVLIPPGEFDMGSPKEQIEEELRLYSNYGWGKDRLPCEGPRHRVRITKPYWLGATEVTQEEYQRVMGSNPSRFQGNPKMPVEQVTWDYAVEFCRRLSELPGEKRAKRRYVLPTEAQWEYACRAGSMGRWCFSSQRNPLTEAMEEKILAEYGWFNANADDQTHPVAQKRANVWGLYDMYGNVWEWCLDRYDRDYYTKSATDDPAGSPDGSDHVDRGGSWYDGGRNCRSALRDYVRPGYTRSGLGLRVS